MTVSRLVGHAVVEQLVELGADVAFGVPGESYLAVLDGLHDHADRLPYVIARQEGGAAMMAAAHGQLTGRPGIAMVTRGPGATNASSGVHVAAQDASPMLLLVGQVPTDATGTCAFQEVDYRQMFGGLAKEVLVLDRADRACELVARAWSVATAGEPGPVVLVTPEDVLLEQTAAPVVPAPPPAVPTASTAAVTALRDALGTAERPLVVVSGTGWSEAGRQALRQLAETADLPVATATRRQDLLDNRSRSFVGTLGLRTTPGLAELARDADVVLLLGARPDGLTVEEAGWRESGQRLLHVYPDPDAFHRVARAELTVAARADDTAVALAALGLDRSTARSAWRERLRDHWQQARDVLLSEGTGPSDPAAFMAALGEVVAPDAILTAGAGIYTGWHQRFPTYVSYPSQLATHSGAMGYGLPAAIAAKLALPEREVVAFAGDGCFLMTAQELATAHQHGLALTVIVVDNGVYGTIRAHQERRFPGRPSGTDLVSPDFAALARAYGAWSARVRTADELGEALRARPAGALCLIHVEVPPEG